MKITIRPEEHKDYKDIVSFILRSFKEGTDYSDGTDIVMLTPVFVHADHLRQGIGSAMIKLGIEKVKEMGFQGVIVEGNYRFYNAVGR